MRSCGRPRCDRVARPSGRYCRPCAAEATRRWRDAQRAAINARRRDRAGQRGEAERRRDSARAQLAVYVQRGRVTPERCAICGTRADVGPYQPDPHRPLIAVWLCRDDRAAGIADAQRRRDREAFDARRAAAAIALARLSAEEQLLLRDRACIVKGVRILPDAPLARMSLVMLVERHLAALASQATTSASNNQAAGEVLCSFAVVESGRDTRGTSPPHR